MGVSRVKGRTTPLSEVEKAWLAAAIDGEGYIHFAKYLTKQGYIARSTSVGVTNTNLDFVNKAVELLGGKIYIKTPKKLGLDKQHYGRKTMYDGATHDHNQVLITLPQIMPYLIIKKQKAQAALDFIATSGFGTKVFSPIKSANMKRRWANGTYDHLFPKRKIGSVELVTNS